MENKKGLFAGIHRDGYTWKDSMIVSIFLFFMMFIAGTGIGLAIGSIIKLFSNGGNAELLEILGGQLRISRILDHCVRLPSSRQIR